ncbi:cbb3-type cytochrome c oxidase subunit 3 [Paracoccus sp. Z118]|uniref:cbb3-type cytochrome c oxidase subunit 3 n=1 Tax=Paracoccus sp. Z118 TaxID=2851017 RepID=UPI001C2C159A|nr:cbb3-type cytochrome c oxidase subunit 3 [Paracoccus sp. Z118]MBV0890992.1 cbb3-type cytochrome c oxidase subunit 3 [Paracoccus sp. Z118]
MDRYSFLRQLADSWVLLTLVLVFLGVIVFVFRPGSRRAHRDAAESIFRNEKKPAPEPESDRAPDRRPGNKDDH